MPEHLSGEAALSVQVCDFRYAEIEERALLCLIQFD